MCQYQSFEFRFFCSPFHLASKLMWIRAFSIESLWDTAQESYAHACGWYSCGSFMFDVVPFQIVLHNPKTKRLWTCIEIWTFPKKTLYATTLSIRYAHIFKNGNKTLLLSFFHIKCCTLRIQSIWQRVSLCVCVRLCLYPALTWIGLHIHL